MKVWQRTMLAGIFVGFLIGCLFLALIGRTYPIGYRDGYKAGYDKGYAESPELTTEDLKALMVTNTDTMNKLCYLWWFKMDTTERKLKWK